MAYYEKSKKSYGKFIKVKRRFHNKLDQCINKTKIVEEFRTSWSSMVEKYGVQEYEYLKYLHDICHRWALTYFHDIFFAEMSTMQCSESTNALFNGYVNSRTAIYQFVNQYEKQLKVDMLRNMRTSDFTNRNQGCGLDISWKNKAQNYILEEFIRNP